VTQRWKAKRAQKLPLTKCVEPQGRSGQVFTLTLAFPGRYGLRASAQAKRPPHEKGKRQAARPWRDSVPFQGRQARQVRSGARLRDCLRQEGRCRARARCVDDDVVERELGLEKDEWRVQCHLRAIASTVLAEVRNKPIVKLSGFLRSVPRPRSAPCL
jgi:hypothetical protein